MFQVLPLKYHRFLLVKHYSYPYSYISRINVKTSWPTDIFNKEFFILVWIGIILFFYYLYFIVVINLNIIVRTNHYMTIPNYFLPILICYYFILISNNARNVV